MERMVRNWWVLAWCGVLAIVFDVIAVVFSILHLFLAFRLRALGPRTEMRCVAT